MKNCKNKECPNVNPQPLDNFYNEKGFKDGKMAICKTCKSAKVYAWRKKNPAVYNKFAKQWRDSNPDKQHANEIKRRYGLSLEDYNNMLVAQDCKCAICPRQHDPSKKRGRLYVDHCHKTGRVRALLCAFHNSMLGYAEDNIETLEKAIIYIKEHGAHARVILNAYLQENALKGTIYVETQLDYPPKYVWKNTKLIK